MIKFWEDHDRLFSLVAVRSDSICIHQFYVNSISSSSINDIRRDNLPHQYFRSIRFDDVRVNKKILAAGYKI